MQPIRFTAICAVLAVSALTASVAEAAKAPATWDNMNLVKSEKFALVYLHPGADFKPYTKVLIDPPEVSFAKNWVKDYNNSTQTVSRRLDDAHAQKIMDAARTGMADILAKAYRNGGYQVVQAPGPDVLRVRTAIADLSVTAPDIQSAGRSRSFANEAGFATFVIEARDSQTGALLGRALDRKVAGDTLPLMRNSVTNMADFHLVFDQWAKASVQGLNKLKATPSGGAETSPK
jgi:hypothetical protein